MAAFLDCAASVGRNSLWFRLSGGEGGIRTLGTGVSPYNGLANRRIRPLCHLSGLGDNIAIVDGKAARTQSSCVRRIGFLSYEEWRTARQAFRLSTSICTNEYAERIHPVRPTRAANEQYGDWRFRTLLAAISETMQTSRIPLDSGALYCNSATKNVRGTIPMGNRFMARAIRLSIDNVLSGKGGPFGAVIVKSGQIVAEGVNRVTLSNDPTAHAEVVAIRAACVAFGTFLLEGCEIYTSCEPCPMCLGAIYWAHLERIHFGSTAADASKSGFDDSFIYQEIARPIGERSIPMVRTMSEDAQVAFRAWQDKTNKLLY
jgi:guanine deaminase